MSDNYARIVRANLDTLFDALPPDLAERLPACRRGNGYFFDAFGQTCCLAPKAITLDDVVPGGVLGILISLYALNAHLERCTVVPLQSFRELPGAMPYLGAFGSHVEQPLVPHVHRIREHRQALCQAMAGRDASELTGSDFAMLLYPLPKVALCYVFYEADEAFPASVTCLFSHNAQCFLPTDALADVGEHTSRWILSRMDGGK
jgi:hypothetical protein